MRTKEVAILVAVLLFTSLVANVYAIHPAKKMLEKGDTRSEVLSSYTMEEIKHDKYLSKLFAKYEQEREDGVRKRCG